MTHVLDSGDGQALQNIPTAFTYCLLNAASVATSSLDADLFLTTNPGDATPVLRLYSTAVLEVSLNTGGPRAAAGFLPRRRPGGCDLGLRASAEGDSTLQGIDSAPTTDGKL